MTELNIGSMKNLAEQPTTLVLASEKFKKGLVHAVVSPNGYCKNPALTLGDLRRDAQDHSFSSASCDTKKRAEVNRNGRQKAFHIRHPC